MKRVWGAALIGLLAGAAYFAVGLVTRSGALLDLDTQLADQCHRVTVAPGAEDIHYDPATGLVFISADNRKVPHHPTPDKALQGLAHNGIYVVDVTAERIENIGDAHKVSPENFAGFRPHGLYVWQGDDGQKRLFVVNHHTSADGVDERVEIFAIGAGGALTHLESITFADMSNPNDVVATGPRQFYVTNFLRHREDPMLRVEVFLALRNSSVAYFDGQAGRIVAKGLAGANGINRSPDAATVYVSEWTRRRVVAYERGADNSLRKSGHISVPTLPDNLDVAPNGDVWVAGQPKLLEISEYLSGKREVISSLAAKINADSGAVKTQFVSINGELSTASVAAVAGDKLLIGSVFDDHILVCRRPG